MLSGSSLVPRSLVIDMRWGVSNQDTDDHSVSQVCFQEITNCIRLSLGPNFVAILGDRYGYRELPPQIPEVEFKALRSQAVSKKLDNVELMDEWFDLDTNAVPPTYFLKKISSKLPFFLDNNPTNADKKKEQTRLWFNINRQLTAVIQSAAKAAFEDMQLSKDRFQEYYFSITSKEIMRGVFENPRRNDQALCYTRKLSNKTGLTADKWIDLKDGEIDSEAQELLNDLKENQTPNFLSPENIRNYTAVMDQENYTSVNEDYLNQFCKDFISDVTRLIDQAYNRQKSKVDLGYFTGTDKEVLLHSHFCQSKYRSFCGQTDFLAAVKGTLETKGNHPIVIAAESGSGKTSLMAKIAQAAPTWINPNLVKVLRFLGTSLASTQLSPLLRSIFKQLHMIYNLDIPDIDSMPLQGLVKHFNQLLSRVSSLNDRPLLILLDALDQMSANELAHRMDWLPTVCPPNVYIIVSTLPQQYGILFSLKKILGGKLQFLSVPKLSESTIKDIMKMSLQLSNRKLTDFQESCLMTAFKQCPQPLYMKILLEEAKTWTSFKKDSIELAPNTMSAIYLFFRRLQARYPPNLVKYALGYLCIGMNGLSEVELEDLLSLKDECMDEVFQYHDPPVDGVVHIPSSIWPRIKNNLGDFLVERQSSGKMLLSWFHRMVLQVAFVAFVSDQTDQAKPEQEVKIASFKFHQDIVRMLMAENGVHSDIVLTQRNKTIPNANRHVMPQPTTAQNVRKLTLLPYHMLQSGPFEIVSKDIKEHIFYNLSFLLAKLHSAHVGHLMMDFNNILNQNSDKEIELMRDFIGLCRSRDLTNKDVPYLIVEILGRLPSLAANNQHLRRLVENANQYLAKYKHPLMVPVFPFLPAPGGLLRATITGPDKLFPISTEQPLIVMKGPQCGCGAWYLLTNEQVRSFERGHEFTCEDMNTLVSLSPSGKQVARCNGQTVIIWDVFSGNITQDVSIPVKSQTTYTHIATHEAATVIADTSGAVTIISNGKINQCQAHNAELSSLHINSNGKIIVAVSNSQHKLAVIPVTSGMVMNTIPLPGECIKLLISSDGRFAVAACQPHVFLQVDITNAKSLGTMTSSKAKDIPIRDFIMSGNGLYYLSTAGFTLNIWKASTQQLLQQLTSEDAEGGLDLVCLDPTEHFAFTSDVSSGDVDVWHLSSAQRLTTFEIAGRVTGFTMHPSTSTLYTTSTDRKCCVWNTGAMLHNARTKCLPFLKDAKVKKYEKAMLSGDLEIKSKDVQVLSAIGMQPYTSGIDLIEGYSLPSGSGFHGFHLGLDDAPAKKIKSVGKLSSLSYPDINKPVTKVLLASNTKSLICIYPGQGPAVYNQDTGTLSRQLYTSCKEVKDVCFGLDEKILLGIVESFEDSCTYLQAWDFKYGDEAKMKLSLPVKAMCITHKRDRVVTCTTETGALHFTVLHLQVELEVCNSFTVPMENACKQEIHWLKISHDQTFFILGFDSPKFAGQTECIVIDVADNIGKIKKDQDVSLGFGMITLMCKAESPVHVILQDNTVLSGSSQGDINHWDLKTCQMINPLFTKGKETAPASSKFNKIKYVPPHHEGINEISTSPDQNLLAVSSADRRISLWSCAQKFLFYLEGHKDEVLCAAISDDKQYASSGSKDQTIRLWSLTTKDCLCYFTAYNDIFEIHMSSDNRRIIARSDKEQQKICLLKILNIKYQ